MEKYGFFIGGLAFVRCKVADRSGCSRCGVRRPLPAPPPAPYGVLGAGSRRPTTSAARGTGTATRAPAATSRPPTTRTASTRTSRPSGSGRRSTPPSPRSSATCGHVADQHDLRRDIRFSTRVESRPGTRPPRAGRCAPTAVTGHAAGSSYGDRVPVVPKTPDIEGADSFQGDGLLHEPLAARAGRLHRSARRRHRHRVVGHPVHPAHRHAGSGADRVPAHAELLAARLQRPDPPSSGSTPSEDRARVPRRRPGCRSAACPWTADVSAERAKRTSGGRVRQAWASGELFALGDTFADLADNPVANEIVSEMFREQDPRDRGRPRRRPRRCARRTTRSAPSGRASTPATSRPSTSRTCASSTCARIRSSPSPRPASTRPRAVRVRRHRLRHRVRCDDRCPRRRRHPWARRTTLKDRWADGPTTYLGLTSTGSPTCSSSPGRAARRCCRTWSCRSSSTSTGWRDCLDDMRAEGFDAIEPTPAAEAGWDRHVQDFAAITLCPRANSWYMGANVPGKPRVLLPYIGGVGVYRAPATRSRPRLPRFRPVAARAVQCNDGVVRDSARRRGRARHDGGARPTADGDAVRQDARAMVGVWATRIGRPGPRWATSSTACSPGRRPAPLPPLPTCDPGAAPDRRLLPRRRLDARGPRLGRPTLSRPVRALRRRRPVGQLPHAPERGSRRRSTTGSRRCMAGRCPRRSSAAFRDSGSSAGGCGRGHRRGRLPDLPRRRRPGRRRAGAVHAGDRRAAARRERRGLRADGTFDGVVLGALQDEDQRRGPKASPLHGNLSGLRRLRSSQPSSTRSRPAGGLRRRPRGRGRARTAHRGERPHPHVGRHGGDRAVRCTGPRPDGGRSARLRHRRAGHATSRALSASTSDGRIFAGPVRYSSTPPYWASRWPRACSMAQRGVVSTPAAASGDRPDWIRRW